MVDPATMARRRRSRNDVMMVGPGMRSGLYKLKLKLICTYSLHIQIEKYFLSFVLHLYLAFILKIPSGQVSDLEEY